MQSRGQAGPALPVLAALLCVALSGCKQVPDIAAAGGGIAAGTVTANPGVAIAVGLGVRALANEANKYVGRTRQGGEQDAIADAAGALPVGGTAPWAIHHTIPIGNEEGTLTVTRQISTPLVECKEVVFTVVDGKERALFTTQLCRRGDHWKWASAEPAVQRWGFLQ